MSAEDTELVAKIAGNVVASENPGKALRMWREKLKMRQVDVADEIGVSSSVLSDYESGRRFSPGTLFVKKYVRALIRLDQKEKKLLERVADTWDRKAILAIGEFKRPVKVKDVVASLDAKVLTGMDQLNSILYGYTVLDSIKTIYALSGFDFYRIFGASTERVLVFTKVGLGRSPLVAVRVSPLKPRMVAIHGPKEADPVALKLAQKENIVLVISSLRSEKELVDSFKSF